MPLEGGKGLRIFASVSVFLRAAEYVSLHAVSGAVEFWFGGVPVSVINRRRTVPGLCGVAVGVVAGAPVVIAGPCAVVVAIVGIVVSALTGSLVIVGILSMTGVADSVVVCVPLETGSSSGDG